MSVRALLVLGALAALAGAGGATAQEADLVVSAHAENGEYWFTAGDSSARNPTLVLPPGAAVSVRFANADELPHNLHFGDPLNRKVPILHPGREAAMVIEVPPDASGESHYWCDPHLPRGMGGRVRFASPLGVEGGEDGPAQVRVPAPAALAVALALATASYFRPRPPARGR